MSGQVNYYMSTWVKNTNSFRNLLNTSKGRDKCAQFIQYVAGVYIACMRQSDNPEIHELVRQKKEPSFNRVKKLEGNISNGRKIFRLALWLNEISEIENLIKNTKMNKILRILKIISTFCSLFYYVADNAVWLAGLDFISPRVRNLKWKQLKNTCSLWKTILELFISLFIISLKTQQERVIKAKLAAHSHKTVQLDTEQYVLVRELMILRREIAFHLCEFFIYSARMWMLTKALKLPGSSWLSEVFVACCGLFQSGMQVFKGLRGKKHFHKLTIEDVKQKTQKKQEEQA